MADLVDVTVLVIPEDLSWWENLRVQAAQRVHFLLCTHQLVIKK
jgi:hypothetical protein